MRQLSIERLINVFKLLAVCKDIYAVPVAKLHSSTTEQLRKIKKNLIWKRKKTKIKHKTLYNNYQTGDLRNVGISNETPSMQCSFVKGLYEEDFYNGRSSHSFR